jgi:hypothetical protein
MKDIMDIYEESKFPALLEILFFMIIVIEITLAIWISFMAPLHISKMPYLKIVYMILIPITYIFPLLDLIVIKKVKKHLLLINNTYLSIRALYFSFYFINEIQYRITEITDKTDRLNVSSTINSGIFCIVFVLMFSTIWIILINLSKKIKYYINDNYDPTSTV